MVHALSSLFTNMLIWQNCTEKTLFKVGFDNSCSSLHNIYLEGAAVHINLTWTYFKWIFRNWNSTRVTKGSIIREWSDRVSRVVPCTLYNIQAGGCIFYCPCLVCDESSECDTEMSDIGDTGCHQVSRTPLQHPGNTSCVKNTGSLRAHQAKSCCKFWHIIISGENDHRQYLCLPDRP